MHDLIRSYAARNQTGSEHDTALLRVIDFYLHTARNAEQFVEPHRPPIDLASPTLGCRPDPIADRSVAMQWFDIEHRCMLAAQAVASTRGWHQTVWQLAWTLDTFLYRRAHRHARIAAWQAGLAAADHFSDPVPQILSHRFLGDSYAVIGQHDKALEHLHQSLNLAEHTDDRSNQAHGHLALAWAWEVRPDYRHAVEHATRALRLFHIIDTPVWEGRALAELGLCNDALGEYGEARKYAEIALTMHRRNRDLNGEAYTLETLGDIASHTGQYNQAIYYYQQALSLLRDIGNTFQRPVVLGALGRMRLALGERDQAEAMWREALKLYQAHDRTSGAEWIQRRLDTLIPPARDAGP